MMKSASEPPAGRIRYEPRILEVLRDAGMAMTREQISAALQIRADKLGNALGRLVGRGAIVAHMRGRGLPALYAAKDAKTTRPKTRQWISEAPHHYAAAPVVTLPLEPWADTVPAEAPQIASGRPYRPASVAGATSGHPGAANAASGPRLEGR